MQNKLPSLFLLLSSLLLTQTSYASLLTPEQQQAKEQGIAYYMIQHCKLAEPLLKQAADAGDSDSQYYYADCRYQHAQMITPQIAALYQKAAEQGYPKVMLKYADILSKQGDAKAVEQDLIASANTGFIDGILDYAIILRDGDIKGFNTRQDLVKSYALFSLFVSHYTRWGNLAESSIKTECPLYQQSNWNRLKPMPNNGKKAIRHYRSISINTITPYFIKINNVSKTRQIELIRSCVTNSSEFLVFLA